MKESLKKLAITICLILIVVWLFAIDWNNLFTEENLNIIVGLSATIIGLLFFKYNI